MLTQTVEIWLLGGLALATFLTTSDIVNLSNLFSGNDDDGSSSSSGTGESTDPVGPDLDSLAEDPNLAAPPEDFALSETLTGTEGTDTLEGNSDDFLLSGFGALVEGLAGDDILDASNSEDIIYGGDGDDNIQARLGSDWAYGGAGNDTIGAGWQNDVVFGDSGDDNLTGFNGSDTLFGGEGDDYLQGSSTGATLRDSDVEVDTLFGGDGRDTLYLGQNDIGHGGSGADTYQLQASQLTADTFALISSFVPDVDVIEIDMRGYEGADDVQALPLDDPSNIGVFLGGQLIAVIDGQEVGGTVPDIILINQSETV